MSWSDRRAFLLMPLALAACGFSPTLAPGSAAAGLQGKIRVADPKDKNGFDFLQRMEERLGRPDMPLYDLSLYDLDHGGGRWHHARGRDPAL